MSLIGNRNTNNGSIPVSKSSLRIRRLSCPASLSFINEDKVRFLSAMVETENQKTSFFTNCRQLESMKPLSFQISKTVAEDVPVDLSNDIEKLFISTTRQLDPSTPPNSPTEESKFNSGTFWPSFSMSSANRAFVLISEGSDSTKTYTTSTMLNDTVNVSASSELFQSIFGSSSTTISKDSIIKRGSLLVPVDLSLSDPGINSDCAVEEGFCNEFRRDWIASSCILPRKRHRLNRSQKIRVRIPGTKNFSDEEQIQIVAISNDTLKSQEMSLSGVNLIEETRQQ